MIGFKIQKDDMEKYAVVAVWCNHNRAKIVEYDEYYEVEEIPEEKTDALITIRMEYLPKLENIKKGIIAGIASGRDISKLQELHQKYTREMKAQIDRELEFRKQGK